MQRASTTVLVIVGDAAREAAASLGAAANVRAVLPDEAADPVTAAREVLRAAAATRSPYVVTDVDPLAAVAEAWQRHVDERVPVGTLEVAVADATARWRGGTLELPDYYLVLDAEAWSRTRRHWFLGVLHRHAPARVVPVDVAPESLRRAVGRLRAGRWWPRVPDLLADVETTAPDDPRTAPDDRAGPRLVTR